MDGHYLKSQEPIGISEFIGVQLNKATGTKGLLRQDIKNEKIESIGSYFFLVIRLHYNRHSRHGCCKKP